MTWVRRPFTTDIEKTDLVAKKRNSFIKSNLQDTLIINEYSDLKPLIHGSQVYEPQTACNK